MEKHDADDYGRDRPAPLVIIADGWTRSVFRELLDDNMLPEIEEHLISHGGLISDVVSNLPSVSIASHTSILTSSYQDEHGIPGHRWKDSATGAITSYLTIDGPQKVNRDISPTVRTPFEHGTKLGGIAVQSLIQRGASTYRKLPTMRSGPILSAIGRMMVKDPYTPAVAWLPRVDAMAHVHGAGSGEVRRDMRETSRAIGRLASILSKGGILEESRIAFVPDHGHRDTVRSVKIEQILALANVLTRVNVSSVSQGESIVLTSGDSSAQLYLEDSLRGEEQAIASAIVDDPRVELACWVNGEGVWNFAGKPGRSTAKPLDGGLVEYRIIERQDPLGLSDLSQAVLDLQEPRPEDGTYPDFLHQVMRSHVFGRSGDILIFPSKDYHFGRGPRIGWRLGYHRGSHGGPFEEEVMVSVPYRGFDYDDERAVRSAELLRRLGAFTTVEGYGHGR